MKITVFARKVKYGNNTFYDYSTHLVDKETGERVFTKVKFYPEDIKPKGAECPKNIVFRAGIDGNMGRPEMWKDKDDNKHETPVLWINAYTNGDPWVDESMNQFVDDGE